MTSPTEAMKEKAREIRSQLIYCAGECCTSRGDCGCMNQILADFESVRAEADAAATERAKQWHRNCAANLRKKIGNEALETRAQFHEYCAEMIESEARAIREEAKK